MRDKVGERYAEKAVVYTGAWNPALLRHITEPPPLRILDVGCADGVMGAELKRRGHSVWGIEISLPLAERARERLDGVLTGNLETMDDLPGIPAELDVILFGDVLEHMFNPAAVLQRMKERLSPRGYFVISVPNFGYLPVRMRFLFDTVEYAASGILDDGHIRIFNERMLRRMIEGLGMRITAWSSTFRPLPERIPGLRGKPANPAYRALAAFEGAIRGKTRRLTWPQYVVKVVRI